MEEPLCDCHNNEMAQTVALRGNTPSYLDASLELPYEFVALLLPSITVWCPTKVP